MISTELNFLCNKSFALSEYWNCINPPSDPNAVLHSLIIRNFSLVENTANGSEDII